MGNLHFFHLLFLLQLYLPLLVLSEPYVFPAKFFINCGSDSSEIPLGARRFVGDKTPNSYSVVNGKSITSLQLSTESEDDLYRTARFSSDGPFSYELDITDQGLHVVRLHFFPFANLAAGALFNVSASSKSLLSDFSVNNTSSFPVIKDFFVPITSSKFRIQFIPVNRASLAFVNAIEVFKVPNLEDNQTHLSPAGRNGFYQGLASQLLRTVHRIAFGSQPQSFNDSNVIASQWVVDDGYIVVGRNWATNCPYQVTLALKYDNLGPNDENYNAASANFIPDRVYKTCKQVTLNGSQTSNSTTNITWHFGVRKNAWHLVRVHFCDILGEAANVFTFNLFIYNNFSQPINPYDYTSSTAAPFYKDFVVDSGESDFISVSVVPWVVGNSTRTRFAYLNGLEIMEFVTDPDLEIEISGSKGKKSVFIIIGSVVGFVVICTLLVAFMLFKKRRKAKPLEPMPSYGTLPFGGVSPYIGISSKSVNPPPVPMLNLKLKMPLAEILEATNNFTAKLLIGEGGFGKVYKGTLRNGQKVAVKRSESKHGQGLPEFQTEVIILSKIRHRHLVSLIGYCDEGSEMILVYEFMEKGTLRDHLYKLGGNPEGPALSLLTWRQRLEICIGAAKGLHYLHTGSDGGIIHRDVKSTNILLDEDYVAKVADFGLSKSGLLDPDEFSTGVKGSFGYLDPEYFRCLQFTEKSDVYSFGVVLLEVLCSRPAIINSHRKEEINLAEWGLIWLEKGELEKIVEPSMASEINPNSLRKFGEIVAKCLKPTGAERPAMLDICWDLEYTLQLQQTAVNREPHEDSAIDSSFNMTSRPFQRLPSNNIQTEKGNAGTENDDGSETTESSVFSQLRIDGGR